MLSVYDDAHRAPIEYSDSDESTSDSPPVPLTPGPLDPQHCTVAGRGFSGGAAGSALSLTVVSKDARGIRIPEGGVSVVVSLENSAKENIVTVTATDKKDGTYTATYTAPPRGDYRLCIAMDGVPIGGSPFPVFFSPPTLTEMVSSMLMATRMGSSPEAALKVTIHSRDCLTLILSDQRDTAHENLLNFKHAIEDPHYLRYGLNAMSAMVPDGEDILKSDAIDKCLCISNIALNIKEEQIRQLFQYCGKVTNVTFISEAREAALVEFETALEAGCAIGLNGVSVGERTLSVKLAKAVITGKDQLPSVESIASAQYNALTSATQNAHHLVMQLASLRAVARTALLPAIQAEERKYEGRAQALNAAAEISKKLGYEQSEHFLVPEPLPTNANDIQKLVFDKQKLGGPRHYNGRGRFARQRQRSRSRSPLPFHKRFRRRAYSPPRQRKQRSSSRERRRRHRSRSGDRATRYRRDRRSEDKDKMMPSVDHPRDSKHSRDQREERGYRERPRGDGHRDRSPYRRHDRYGTKHRDGASSRIDGHDR